MKGFAHEARRMLSQMARRAAWHKAMLYLIIITLMLAIVLVLWRMFKNHGRLL